VLCLQNSLETVNALHSARARALQVHDWSFDIHAWSQHEPDFFCLLIMEILKQEGLLVRSLRHTCMLQSLPSDCFAHQRSVLHSMQLCCKLCKADSARKLYGLTGFCADMQSWKIPPLTMKRYLRRCCAAYRNNPYHNAAHAADVTQGMAIMMQMGLSHRLSHIERLGLLLAAATHDLGHPGVSNQFLVNSRDHWALVYNDISVNENVHVSQAFLLAKEEGLFEGLSAEEYHEVRIAQCL
jgi:3'5'-cyclic nucleotide phosphodiesterase